MFLPFQQAVQEVYQQILIDFLTENTFETHVRKRVDEPCHILLFLQSLLQTYEKKPSIHVTVLQKDLILRENMQKYSRDKGFLAPAAQKTFLEN